MKLFNLFLSCLYFLIMEVLLAQAPEPEGWYFLQSPTNNTLRKLYFVDKNNGWASGLSGTIISTTNSGKTWQVQNTNVSTPIVDVFFLNPQKGWALTYPSEPPFGTSILKTTDGGSIWVKDTVFFENEIFSTIFFIDDSTGLIGGQGIRKTTNGGLIWSNSFIEPGGVSTLPVNKFIFYSNSFGYACGGRVDVAGVIWKTSDGGNTWSWLGLSPDQIYDIYIVDSLNAISLSGDPELLYPIGVLRTTNAGITWNFDNLPFFGVAFAIDFMDNKEGWSASGYKFLNTNDGGQTWVEQFIFDSTIVYDLQFIDNLTGFACGQDGVLLKYTSYKKYAPDRPTFEIGQNHPNPFSEKTTFYVYSATPDFDLPARAQIKLYDILGNELLTLADQDFYSGVYEFTFNPSRDYKNISSGIYFLTLISGDIKQSTKILYFK